MAKGKHQIQVLYSFDRLGPQKITQAYRILVPNKAYSDDKKTKHVTQIKGLEDEGSSHLCTGLIRKAKRRTDNR